MKKPRILLAEDEPALAMVVAETLESQGFLVTVATDGEAALDRYRHQCPNLLILDVMLPKCDGFSVAQVIRETDSETPILFLTAKAKGSDVVEGFESGGNDYLRKPFSMEELIVRMRVLLSQKRLLPQSHAAKLSSYRLGRYTFQRHEATLSCAKKTQQLTIREAELLALFCEKPNILITKETLLLSVWGQDSMLNSRSLDVFISRLRKYLIEDETVNIVNLRGSGYKLVLSGSDRP